LWNGNRQSALEYLVSINAKDDAILFLAKETTFDNWLQSVKFAARTAKWPILKQLITAPRTDTTNLPYKSPETREDYASKKAFYAAAIHHQIPIMENLLQYKPMLLTSSTLSDADVSLFTKLAMMVALKETEFIFTRLPKEKKIAVLQENHEHNGISTPVLCSVLQSRENDSDLYAFVKLLIENSANVNCCISNRSLDDNEYALSLAVRTGNAEVVSLLLENKANVDTLNMWKAKNEVKTGTALHIAAHLGNSEIVRRLIAAGSDIKKENSLHQTPLQLAKNKKISRLRGGLTSSDTKVNK
jgi:hypothetical protein